MLVVPHMAIFVGRDRELQTLDEQLEAREGRVLLVSGEAGVGKTRLVEELARRAETRGFVVAWGRSWEEEGTPAYYPWRQAMRRLRASFGPLFDFARAATEELGILLDERHGPMGDDPAEARFRLFDGVAELLRLAAEETPIVLVLDDLHNADVATFQMLHFVSRHVRAGSRLLVAGTVRDGAVRAKSEASQLIARIAREASAIPLGRLERGALVAWLEASVPHLVPSVDRLLSVSEGNPLFVGELLAAAKKHPSHEVFSARALPLGIREAIRAHVAVLTEPAQRVLEVASSLGREFTATSLAARTGDVPASVAEAIDGGLLVPFDTHLRFTHMLIRDELYAALSSDRRAECHRTAAANERDPVLAAPHWLAGGRPEDEDRVFPVLVEALADQSAGFAFEDAAVVGQRALGAYPFSLPQSCGLRIAVGEAWAVAGSLAEAKVAAALAADAARELRDGELFSRAALTYATEFRVGVRDETSVRLLREALTMLTADDASWRARVMGRLASAMRPAPPDEHDDSLRLSDAAIGLARGLEDDETLFTVLRFTRFMASATDDAATRFALNAETIALAKKLGQVALVEPLFSWQVAASIELGDIDAAHRQADEMEALLAAYEQPLYSELRLGEDVRASPRSWVSVYA